MGVAGAERTSGLLEKSAREKFMLVWDLAISAEKYPPQDVREIALQALSYFNPDEHPEAPWRIRRITTEGFKADGFKVTREDLETFLSAKELKIDPSQVIFTFHLYSDNPPQIETKSNPFSKTKFHPELVFAPYYRSGNCIQFLDGTSKLMRLNLPPSRKGIIDPSKDNYGPQKRYHLNDAIVSFEPAPKLFQGHSDWTGMTEADAKWPNIFFQLKVGNVFASLDSRAKLAIEQMNEMERIHKRILA